MLGVDDDTATAVLEGKWPLLATSGVDTSSIATAFSFEA